MSLRVELQLVNSDLYGLTFARLIYMTLTFPILLIRVFGHGSKNIIPSRARYAVSHSVVFVMVNTVKYPKCIQPVFRRFKCMNRIMYKKIERITHYKSGQKCISVIAYYKFKNKKFTKFLNTLDNKQDFLKDVIFDYEITIHSSY